MSDHCTVGDCKNKIKSNGMCKGHYERVRKNSSATGPIRHWGTGEWGKWQIDPKGYVRRERRINGERQYQKQHRVVMENALGRPLLDGENVHHINGDKIDNRIENLELWSTYQPRGQRVDDKVQWAIELLNLYKPEVLK